MKKTIVYLTGLIILMLAVSTVSAGNVVFPWSGSNICQNPSDPMITFEDGTHLLAITNQYPDVLFSIPAGGNWLYEDVTIQGNYPYYWTNGNFWALIDFSNPLHSNTGRIDFTIPKSYVSVLVSSNSDNPGVEMEAYDAGNSLIDQTDVCPVTVGTGTMCQLTVSGNGIRYVLIHDANNYWVIDDLCYGSTGGKSIPEFPSLALPVTMIIGLLGAVLLIQRTGEH
jgi:hypothetical protein